MSPLRIALVPSRTRPSASAGSRHAVTVAHLDVRKLPEGCAVFSRDGYYVGDLHEVIGDRMDIKRREGTLWLGIDDAIEPSVASGLRLACGWADLPRHELAPA